MDLLSFKSVEAGYGCMKGKGTRHFGRCQMLQKEVYRVYMFWVIFSVCSVFVFPFSIQADAKNRNKLLATQIIDQQVINIEGEEIGEVDDMIVRRNGMVKKITVEVGGFFGDKLVAIPFRKLQFKEDGEIVVETTQQQLEKKPEFDYYKRGLHPGYYYNPGGYSLRRYWYSREPYYWPHRYPYPERGPGPYNPSLWAFYPGRFLVSVVMDRYVINEANRRIGEIKDLEINSKGEVENIILSTKYILEKDMQVAVPYKRVGFTAYGIVYDITAEEIRKLPEYSRRD
jgi:sporulation protein YlmC with PRC-barrel domain